MRRHWRSLAVLALVVLGIVLVVGLVWLNDLADPTVEATAAMGSDAAVSVSTEGAIEFQPAEPATTGFILYPGARVAPEAYAPLARAIAEAGYLAVITPMPFGLAVLSPDAAGGVIADHPEIERWVVGGHSLGGAMAAQYAAGHEDLVDGLVLWAAYPADGTDLSGMDLVVGVHLGVGGRPCHARRDRGISSPAAGGHDLRRDRGRQPRRLRVLRRAGRRWRGDHQRGRPAGPGPWRPPSRVLEAVSAEVAG